MREQKARSMGDFLMVGLHTDEDVRARRGPHDPIMDLHERSLSVLGCRYVSEVIIGMAVVSPRDGKGEHCCSWSGVPALHETVCLA